MSVLVFLSNGTFKVFEDASGVDETYDGIEVYVRGTLPAQTRFSRGEYVKAEVLP